MSANMLGCSAQDWSGAIARIFDDRIEDTQRRFLLGVCFPRSALLFIFLCTTTEDRRLSASLHARIPATSIARVTCLRQEVFDLLIVKPGGGQSLFTYGLREVPIRLVDASATRGVPVVGQHPSIARFVNDVQGSVIAILADGSRWLANLNLDTGDELTLSCLRALSMTLPGDDFFRLQLRYIIHWQKEGHPAAEGRSFECFRLALAETFNFPVRPNPTANLNDAWSSLGSSTSQRRFMDDPAFTHLQVPENTKSTPPTKATSKPHELLCPVLNSLQLLAEDFRQALSTEHAVLTLAPLLCDIALAIRPEWADYWKRVIPDVLDVWPDPSEISECFLVYMPYRF
jgi:anaphase-promoting complex subunit 1